MRKAATFQAEAMGRFPAFRRNVAPLGRMLPRRKRGAPFLAFLFCLFLSCRDAVVFHSYQAVSERSGWERGDSLSFLLPSGLPPRAYTLEIGVRNTDAYPYRDIWLAVVRTVPGGTLPVAADTLHFCLADEKGRWNNAGGSGRHYQSAFICGRPFRVGADSCGGVLHIAHIMRDNPLFGISDIGVRLLEK